jgi:hypothetical protein
LSSRYAIHYQRVIDELAFSPKQSIDGVERTVGVDLIAAAKSYLRFLVKNRPPPSAELLLLKGFFVRT